MPDRQDRPKTELPIVQLIPNALTITAICAGLTAIRFGFEGNYERAVLLILAAGILDGLDGSLARFLKSDSKMGAELDSFADFLNFGVAPPLVIHFWVLQDMRGIGWIAVLIYTACCVLRLARFNVASKSEPKIDESNYFTGVPSPAGAGLVMMPMFVSFAISDGPILPPSLIAAYMIGIGLLLISHIPTWSFKSVTIYRENVKFLMIAAVFTGAALLSFTWTTLICLGLAYVAMVLWTLITGKTPPKRTAPKQNDEPD